jgi:glycosyltransferase involved in cell wall biosynthesis
MADPPSALRVDGLPEPSYLQARKRKGRARQRLTDLANAGTVGPRSSMVPITVFTPTYNRSETLPRVRDSLLRQTLDPARFEWLIVDDGSTDGTRTLIESWMDAPFAIRYFWQKNGGKHVAWNRGVIEAHGELFAVLDSDDACVPNALERLATTWSGVDVDHRKDLGGLLARCLTPQGVPIGPPLPRLHTADFAELVFLHGLRHEAWMVPRTEVLRAYPFPELRVGLLPEGSLWHRMGRRYKWLLLDECLRVYFTDDYGRPDQLSHRSAWRIAEGVAHSHQCVLDNSWRFFWQAPVQFLRSAVHFDRFSMHAGLPVFRQIAALEHPPARVLCLSVLPAAFAAYAIDKRRGLDREIGS